MFAALSPAERAALAETLARGYMAARRENGGLFEATDPGLSAVAGDLFDVWCEANLKVKV